jgi:hypothetical protein
MLPIVRAFIVLLFTASLAASMQAQDTRKVLEPGFPPTCIVIAAPLESTSEGPAVSESIAEQDALSYAATTAIMNAISRCSRGAAIELSLGADALHNAFLIDPLSFPPGVSLIIDGGVTVYASRNPANYQIANSNNYVCGAITDDTSDPVCKAVLTFQGDSSNLANSGLYGYGVLDGQGQRRMLGVAEYPQCADNETPSPAPGGTIISSWWGLIDQKGICPNKDLTNENSPLMISAGDTTGAPTAGNFTMYKVTIRNPPFHTFSWGGNGLTIWGVHVQAAWNVPNTDGFDLHGSNATIYDSTVANGDDDIAFAVNATDTKNITVRRFSTYARDGITVLGNGDGQYSISHLLIEDVTMTDDLPSVVFSKVNETTTATINGMSEETLKQEYPVTGYGQALVNSLEDIAGLNIKYTNTSKVTDPTGAAVLTDITFRNVCMQDVGKPINIVQQATPAPGAIPVVDHILYQNVRGLAPNPQFITYHNHTPEAPGSGTYQISFVGIPQTFYPRFTLSNVVFDDTPSGSSLSLITAFGNKLSTTVNIYPSVLNDLGESYQASPVTRTPEGSTTTVEVNDNSYDKTANLSTTRLALPCRKEVPFITGDLYVSTGSGRVTSDETAERTYSAKVGDPIQLDAIVQPVMSQSTHLAVGTPNTVAVASPALTNAVRFYDGLTYVGSAALSANGTLARVQIEHLAPGLHIFTAQYPKDLYYSSLNFGLVRIYAGF